VVEALVKVVNESAGRQKPEWTTDLDDRPADPAFVVSAQREGNPPALVPGVPPDAEMVVAISYGHGDNLDDKGRARGAFVDGLERAMHEWGYLPLRDVNELKNCGLIREFVLTLVQHASGRPRRVVLVLTYKYLRSVYCMAELHAVWQLSLSNRAAFAKRAVPCVIEDDLAIDTPDAQLDWGDYWNGEYERMEARRQARPKAFGPTHLNLLYEIDRWRDCVPEMLAFVSNMVTERGYGALTADGFAAVRRMLDRPERG
jgi:internalin A